MNTSVKSASLFVKGPEVEISKGVRLAGGITTIVLIVLILGFTLYCFFERKLLFDYWTPAQAPTTITNPIYPNGKPTENTRLGKIPENEQIPTSLQGILGSNLTSYQSGGNDKPAWAPAGSS